jgi:hypothetical protein
MTAKVSASLVETQRKGAGKWPREPYTGPLPCPTEHAALLIVRGERERKKRAERNAIPKLPNA